MLEHGAYTVLIDSCYDRERFPTLDDAIDWTWARTDEEINAVKFVLSKFFTLDGDVYIQNRIQDEISEYKSKAETNKRIATERESKRKLSKQSVNEPCTSREDNQDILHEPPPNHKPITINQEPVTIIKDIHTSDKPKKSKSVMKTLPDDFDISEQVRKWASENNHHNLEIHLDRFIEYAKSNGKKYADWDAAFKRAVREDWGKVNLPTFQNNVFNQQPQQNNRMSEIQQLSEQWELNNESNYTPY